MRNLYQFNKIVLIITFVLYLTIIFGLYAQIVLAVIQILSAFGIFFVWNSISTKYKNQLLLYWLAVLIYGIGWKTGVDLIDYWWFIGIIIIPMSIATYFVKVLHNLQKAEH